MKYFKHIIYGVVLLIVAFQFKTCFIKSSEKDIRIDTVEVVKIIKGKTNTFTKDSLIPVYIDTSSHYKELFKSLEVKYSKKIDSITILKELLLATKKRVYKEVFKDSVLNAEIIAHTTGKLDSLKFTYTTKDKAITYNEITKHVQPSFRILAGVRASIGGVNNYSIGVNAGVQTKKGSFYTIGIDTRNNVNISAYLPIFTNY